jgi:hypothetical protein
MVDRLILHLQTKARQEMKSETEAYHARLIARNGGNMDAPASEIGSKAETNRGIVRWAG